MHPPKLRKGDEIRIVAPARSLGLISDENITLATRRLEEHGFKVRFSKNAREQDMFVSSSIASRVSDIHDAFVDKNVKALLTVIGGFNSNQLLEFLDYELIRNNPKIVCGYSDITALANAIYAKTGLVTYSGPHFSSWAMQKGFAYDMNYFSKCLMKDEPFVIEPSEEWSDDQWYADQENRECMPNTGYHVIHKGTAEGTIVGGNLGTLTLLCGTAYMPSLDGALLFIEDDDLAGGESAVEFDRRLQSLLHQKSAGGIKGVVIGRFQKKSKMTEEKLAYSIDTKKVLAGVPVVANADFGHTSPMMTFPIGGTARLEAGGGEARLEILEH